MVQGLDDGVAMPLPLYWSFLGGLHLVSGDRDGWFACQARAAELAPQDPLVQIDWAKALLQHRRDAVGARAILDRLRDRTISDLGGAHIQLLEGYIALVEGDATTAIPALLRARAGLQPFATNGLVQGGIDWLHGLLAIGYAMDGQLDRAEACYAAALPRLIAWDEQAVVEWYQRVKDSPHHTDRQ